MRQANAHHGERAEDQQIVDGDAGLDDDIDHRLGIELDLDRVPVREENMSAYEMMLSESQERMLMVLSPEKKPQAEAVFRKWGLDFAVVGKTTDDLRFRIRQADLYSFTITNA